MRVAFAISSRISIEGDYPFVSLAGFDRAYKKEGVTAYRQSPPKNALTGSQSAESYSGIRTM
jgi:hypothetical protein